MSKPYTRVSKWAVEYDGHPEVHFIHNVVGPCRPGLHLAWVENLPGYLGACYPPEDPAAEAEWRLSSGSKAVGVAVKEIVDMSQPAYAINSGPYGVGVGSSTGSIITGGTSCVSPSWVSAGGGHLVASGIIAADAPISVATTTEE